MSFIVKGKKRKRVASVGVINDGKILMGQRRDNDRWTLPGGHIEEGETSLVGAQRELLEETGIGLTPKKFKSIGYSDVLAYPSKNPIRVYAFKVKYNGPTTMLNDPDNEVKRWYWFDMKDIPDKVMNKLHVRGKNVVFDKLGIYKDKFVVKSDKIKGGLADNKTPKDFDKKKLVVGVGVEKEHTSDKKVAEEIAMDHLVEDPKYYVKLKKMEKSFYIIKSQAGSHKYIRKFRKGGKWIYVYYEAKGRPGRVMDEGAASKVSRLEELGKNIAHAHDENHIRLLRELASRGHQASKDYLDSHQIPHEEETTSTVEADKPDELKQELGLPEISDNPLDQEMNNEEKSKWFASVERGIRRGAMDHLDNYSTSEPAKKIAEIYAGVHPMIAEVFEGANTHADVLRGIQKLSNEIRDKLNGVRSARFRSDASEYGNNIFDETIKEAQSKDLIPEGFGDVFKLDTEDIPNPDRIEEERERERAEQAERLAREYGEIVGIQGENAEAMVSYFNKTLTDENKIKLMKNMNDFWGKDFNFNSFVEAIQGHPEVETKVGSGFFDMLLNGDSYSSVSFNFIEKSTGRSITNASRKISKQPNGGIQWYNSVFSRVGASDLKKYPGLAGGLYGGVYNFLKDVSKNWEDSAKKETHVKIGQAANSGFGGTYKGALVWAKHNFDWGYDRDKQSFKTDYKNLIDRWGGRIGLSEEIKKEMKDKVDGFEYPYQFATMGYRLTKEEAEKAIGQQLDSDFSRLVQVKGSLDIGELMLIGSENDWSGCVAYVHPSEERQQHLDERRAMSYSGQRPESPSTKMLGEHIDSSRATARTPAPRTNSGGSTSSGSSSGDLVADSYIDHYWRPRGNNTNIRMTQQRMRSMRRWPTERVQAFLRNAPLTATARRNIRTMLSERS